MAISRKASRRAGPLHEEPRIEVLAPFEASVHLPPEQLQALIIAREVGFYDARLSEQQFQHGLIEARCEDGVVLTSGEVVSLAE